MKNRLLKSLALLVLSTCLLLPSIGCTPRQEEEEKPDQPPKQTVTLIANTADDFGVMRADQCSDMISGAAVDLRNTLQEQLGYKVGIDNDYVDRNQPIPTDTREILVGLTNRQESIDAHAALSEHEYLIRMTGTRLIIIGYDEECTVAAVKAFVGMLPAWIHQQEEIKILQMEQGYEYKGTYERKVWLDAFDKTSYSYYLDENLTCKEKSLLGLDSWDDVPYTGSFPVESPAGEGIGFRTEYDNNHWMMINTPTDSFSLAITDKFKQTVKMWVYINDTNRIACDHDAVYNTPQVGSQTLYITLSEKQDGIGHTWQHTFYGEGWHEIELSFTCHNVAYPYLADINYDNLTSLRVWCNAKAGLEVSFADMRLCTYDNPNYHAPAAPYGGRWLSTCDYDALDGPILTEWYGSYYDPDEKVQGSSSLAITGHNENVDHRVCIGIDDVDVVYAEDTICFDMYISDLKLLGTDWQIRLEHNAQAAHYSANYEMIASSAVNEKMQSTHLKSGWNHIQLPLNKTRVSIGAEYTDQFTNDLTLTQLVFYIAGTGKTEEQNYLIRYDNMYVAKTADLQAAKAALK